MAILRVTVEPPDLLDDPVFGDHAASRTHQHYKVGEVLVQRLRLELNLLKYAAVGVEPAPEAEAVEKVLTAPARVRVYAVKLAPDSVVKLLLAERAYLLRQLGKASVDNVHIDTPVFLGWSIVFPAGRTHYRYMLFSCAAAGNSVK